MPYDIFLSYSKKDELWAKELSARLSRRKRFRREALALSKLNHPHIATVFDFDTQDGVDFLAMEFIQSRCRAL